MPFNHEQGERGRLLLACCCCHLPSQLQPFCARSRKPVLNNFLTLVLILFWKTRFFLSSENLISHFFLLAFSFAPSCLVCGLRSTPSVSPLFCQNTPSLLLHTLNFSSKYLQENTSHCCVLCFQSAIDSFKPFFFTSPLDLFPKLLVPTPPIPCSSLSRKNYVTSLWASCNKLRRSKQLHFDPTWTLARWP